MTIQYLSSLFALWLPEHCSTLTLHCCESSSFLCPQMKVVSNKQHDIVQHDTITQYFFTHNCLQTTRTLWTLSQNQNGLTSVSASRLMTFICAALNVNKCIMSMQVCLTCLIMHCRRPCISFTTLCQQTATASSVKNKMK